MNRREFCPALPSSINAAVRGEASLIPCKPPRDVPKPRRWPGVPEQPARPLEDSRSCGRRGAGVSATALVTKAVGHPALRAAACAPSDVWGGSAAAKSYLEGGEGGGEGSRP